MEDLVILGMDRARLSLVNAKVHSVEVVLPNAREALAAYLQHEAVDLGKYIVTLRERADLGSVKMVGTLMLDSGIA